MKHWILKTQVNERFDQFNGNRIESASVWISDDEKNHIALLMGKKDLSEENGRLMAAAPTMLFALEAVLEIIKPLDEDGKACLDLVSSAIAKAKGDL